MRSIYEQPNVPLKAKLHDIVDPGVVVRVSKFDEEGAAKFADQMSKAHQTQQDVIPVVVDSFGGSVYDLMTMVTEIRNSEKPVATVVEGKAMSCGAVLFSCGTEGMRFMSPRATLMIHEVSTVTWGKNQEVQADAVETDRLNKELFQIMAKNCGHKKNYFLDIVHGRKNADWFLTPKQAKKHNLANHIRIPSMRVRIDVRYDFG